MKIYVSILILFMSFYIVSECHSQEKPTDNWQVIDGDTIRHGDRVIRLWGIDAPEINQRCLKSDGVEYKCGRESKFALEEIIKNSALVCTFINRDRYKREVAQCYLDGVDIGGIMVSLGRAVEYRKYSKGHYEIEQLQAQKKGLGLWQGEFIEPKNYRRGDI